MKKDKWKSNEMINGYVMSYRFADMVMMIFVCISSFILIPLKGTDLFFMASFLILFFIISFCSLMFLIYSKQCKSKYWTILENEIEIATKKDGTLYSIDKNEMVKIIGGGKYHFKIEFLDTKGVIHKEKVDYDFLDKTNLKFKR